MTLTIFQFENHKVRFVGSADKPEWIAQDVCDVLGIADARSSLRDFTYKQKGMHSMHTLGGEQELLTVTEAGLYRLIFKSRKAIAERFQNWVCDEVLPSIRQTGTYSVPSASLPPPSTPRPTDAIALTSNILKQAGISEPLVG